MQIDFDIGRFKVAKDTKKIRSEHDDIIQRFTDGINACRVNTKYKPLSCRAVAVKVSVLKGFDLKWFLRECEKADSFSRYFFGCLKVNKK